MVLLNSLVQFEISSSSHGSETSVKIISWETVLSSVVTIDRQLPEPRGAQTFQCSRGPIRCISRGLDTTTGLSTEKFQQQIGIEQTKNRQETGSDRLQRKRKEANGEFVESFISLPARSG